MIVVVGESLVDLSRSPDGNTVESVGGSPLNVGVALGRLEIPALLITEVGNDARGERIVAHVQDAEIELIAAPSRGGRTSTASVREVPGGLDYDLDVTWQLPGQELPHCDALHVGSLGTVLEPGRDSVLDLVEQAWARDVFVSYDPNIRASVMRSQGQTWRDVESLADRSNLVKISEQDIDLLHPGADPDDIARSLLTGDRTELVILTRGGDGSTAFVGDLVIDVPASDRPVVDTVGAGDAFMAGALAVLFETDAMGQYAGGVPHDQAAVERLLRAATEVAAINCSRPGADAPRRSELPSGWPG